MNRRPKGGTVLEVDIRKFFDYLDHSYLRQFLRLRVRDGVLLRLIDKWLKAGVLEDGNVSYPDSGSPQGGVISPIISNVFLHYVLDLWFEKRYARSCRGRAYLVRYADDFIACFQDEGDARRFVEELTKRLADFDLEVAPSKTAVLRFGSATTQNCERDGRNRPQTFNFLGLTH